MSQHTNCHARSVLPYIVSYAFFCSVECAFFTDKFSQYIAVFYLLFQSIWSIVLTCATATFYAILFECNGIPAISAHCTNAANIHASFRRNFSQMYTLSAEQTVTAFLRKGQNARYVFSLIQITR